MKFDRRRFLTALGVGAGRLEAFCGREALTRLLVSVAVVTEGGELLSGAFDGDRRGFEGAARVGDGGIGGGGTGASLLVCGDRGGGILRAGQVQGRDSVELLESSLTGCQLALTRLGVAEL